MEKNKIFPLEQVGIRMVEEPPLYSERPVRSAQDVVKLMADTLRSYDREVLAVVNFKQNMQPINVNIASMGSLNASIANPRELLKSMVLSNAAVTMLVHNHPSGNLEPSKDDIRTTDQMHKLCELIGIQLMDHVIVGPTDRFYSFAEHGTLPLAGLQLSEIPEDIHLLGMKVAEGGKNYADFREHQAMELKEISDKLVQGVTEVFQSEKYQEFLNTMAKFPRYSVNNSLLIMLQKPEAQLVQSFTGWKEMGRYVKKGEKGIRILAPAPYKTKREQVKVDVSGKTVLGKNGEPEKELVEVTINAFKPVSTFDVSQTEGKELPSYGVDELVGSIEGYPKLVAVLQEISPVPIRFEEIEGRAKGFYSQSEKRIAIQDGMSEVQSIKTILHEMAHQMLHDQDQEVESHKITRNKKEVEAESVAYVICQHYGINTADYSFSYVAGWSEGKELPELKSSLNKIRKAASELITKIDEKLKGLEQERSQEPVKETEKKEEALVRIADEPRSFKQILKEKTEQAAKNLSIQNKLKKIEIER